MCVCLCDIVCLKAIFYVYTYIYIHTYIYTHNVQPFCCPRSRGGHPILLNTRVLTYRVAPQDSTSPAIWRHADVSPLHGAISRDLSCRGSSQKDVGVRLRQWNVAGLQGADGAGFLWWQWRQYVWLLQAIGESQCHMAGKFFMLFICEVSHPWAWVAGHNLVKVEIDDAF